MKAEYRIAKFLSDFNVYIQFGLKDPQTKEQAMEKLTKAFVQAVVETAKVNAETLLKDGDRPWVPNQVETPEEIIDLNTAIPCIKEEDYNALASLYRSAMLELIQPTSVN